MSAISLKSITGITSITTPAGVDNQLTLHTNNTTERVKINSSGNVSIANDLDVDGHTNLDNVSIAGVTTITSTSNEELFRIETSFGNPGNTQGKAYMGFDHFYGSTKPAILIGSEEEGTSSYKGAFVIKLKDAAATDNDPVERFRILSNGNVGIGTDTVPQKLSVKGTISMISGASGTQIVNLAQDGSNNGYIMVNDSSGTTRARLDSSGVSYVRGGNFGIGLTNPTSVLHVSDTEASGGVSLTLTNIGDGGFSTTPFCSIDAKLNLIRNGGQIRFGREGVYGDQASADSFMAFYTAQNDTNNERLRIGSNGYVNIGTGSAEQQLTVQNSAQHSLIRVISKNDSDAGIDFGDVDDTDRAGIRYTNLTDTLGIIANADTRVVIDSSGRVMIGGGSSPSQVGDGRLIVYASERLHPAIKADCLAGGSNAANGFTMLADNYLADESICNFGISYSGAGLVLSRGVKVSNAADDTYLSSMDSYAVKPAVFKLDDSGDFKFLNTDTSATTTTDSAVTLYERLRITSSGDMGLSNTGTNDPNNYSGWCTLTINGTNGSELDFEKGGTLYGDILASNTQFNFTTRESTVDINFATKNNAGSTANRLTINSEGNIQHKSGSGVSYFNGASEYVFGSTGSSPSQGGAEANVQIHAHKTRAQFSINAYMNNAGGPFMQMVSSRSGTVGQLGTVTLNNDVLGDIRFSADDGNGGIVYGAQIKGRAKTQATTNGVAGRIEFSTAKDASSGTRDVFSMNEGGALTAESESPALYGYLTSNNNQNFYVDFPQWTRDSFVCLEIFGNVNPNSAGSGAYSDPVHMYVYRGVGWTGSRVGYYIYSVSVAPPARHAFPSGTGYSGNAQISAVWTDGSSNNGNETATSTNYVRLLVPNANSTYSFTKSFRIFRRR